MRKNTFSTQDKLKTNKRKNFFSIRAKVLLFVVLNVMVSGIILGTIIGFKMHNWSNAQFRQFIRQQFEVINYAIHEFTKNTKSTVKTLAEYPVAKKADSAFHSFINDTKDVLIKDMPKTKNETILTDLFAYIKTIRPEFTVVYFGTKWGGASNLTRIYEARL